MTISFRSSFGMTNNFRRMVSLLTQGVVNAIVSGFGFQPWPDAANRGALGCSWHHSPAVLPGHLRCCRLQLRKTPRGIRSLGARASQNDATAQRGGLSKTVGGPVRIPFLEAPWHKSARHWSEQPAKPVTKPRPRPTMALVTRSSLAPKDETTSRVPCAKTTNLIGQSQPSTPYPRFLHPSGILQLPKRRSVRIVRFFIVLHGQLVELRIPPRQTSSKKGV